MIGTLKNIHPDPFRSPMQHRQPVSYPCPRDLPASVEYDIPASSSSRFPTSSLRPDGPQNTSAIPPAHPPEPVYPRHDPLHILAQTTPPPPPRSYSTVLPAPSVAPGILADGVLTAKLPSVKKFLQAATIAPPEYPPMPTDERVLALVALSVFYHPLHPAHWAFWNKEQKKATAAMVQSVLDTTPTPILSPIGWIDVPENLWILKSMQSAYSSTLASKPWYSTYTPAEPETRMNLRKRRAPAIQPTSHGADGDETVDEEERVTPPPRKRAKTRRSAANRSGGGKAKEKANHGIMEDDAMQQDGPATLRTVDSALLLTPDPSPSAPAVTKTAKREVIESLGIVLTVSAEDEFVQPEPPDVEEEAPELRKSLRQLERKAKAAGTASPASVASTLTPSVRTRGLSQLETPSRESSSVTPESIGGADSGSSTAVSLCDEEGTKSKSAKSVEEVLEDEEDEAEEEPAAKRARTARSKGKGGSRARTGTKNKTETVTEEAKTNTTAQARSKTRSRAKTRRR